MKEGIWNGILIVIGLESDSPHRRIGIQSFGRQDVWATMMSRLDDKSKSLHLGQLQSLGRSRHH